MIAGLSNGFPGGLGAMPIDDPFSFSGQYGSGSVTYWFGKNDAADRAAWGITGAPLSPASFVPGNVGGNQAASETALSPAASQAVALNPATIAAQTAGPLYSVSQTESAAVVSSGAKVAIAAAVLVGLILVIKK